MADLEEIAKQPGYDPAATVTSKFTILVFVATFCYLVFFTDTTPSFVGGAVFLVTGIFVVSIVISMPLFLIRAKFPRFGPLVAIMDIAVTVFLTRTLYLWLFSQPAVAPVFEPRSFLCNEPLPEFTLNEMSDPTDAELKTLCLCIYRKLDANDRHTSQAISEGRESDVTEADIQQFIPKFGEALERCGGKDL